MVSLRQLTVIFATLFMLPSILGAALAPRASGTPQCQYKCPSHDKKGNPLDNQMDTGPNIKCTYGHNPVRNCFYDREDGSPKNGNHAECQDRAYERECTGNGTPPDRRRSKTTYNAYQAQQKRRAARPAPSIPEYMSKRAGLKKRSHDAN